MITIIENKFKVNVNSKIIFRDKLLYISEILTDISKKFNEQEQDVEDKFWFEIGDITDLSESDYEFHCEQLENLQDKHKHFPQILYKSLIVSIYSVLETTLYELILSTEKTNPKRIKYKHLKANSSEIENYLNYLNLVYEQDFNDMNDLLNDLKCYADIRNNIVHKNGNLKDDIMERKNRIKKFALKIDTIEIEKDEKLFIKDCKFVFDFLDLSEKFGFKLFGLYNIDK